VLELPELPAVSAYAACSAACECLPSVGRRSWACARRSVSRVDVHFNRFARRLSQSFSLSLSGAPVLGSRSAVMQVRYERGAMYLMDNVGGQCRCRI
jgi:hypothetical protein